MLTVASIAEFLERFAPQRLAAEWDNVGLLVGRASQPVRRIMTCLTLTRSSVAEAVAAQVDLVVSHHPLPFHPLRRLTDASTEGELLLDLIAGRVAVFSPHTAFDSAARGINQSLAEGIGLHEIHPLEPDAIDPTVGTGRSGCLAEPEALGDFARRVSQFLGAPTLQVVGDPGRRVRSVAVACGSAGELLSAAREQHCDCLVTGEARFHACLEAEAGDIALVLAGHFASERFGVELLAERLAAEFSAATVWASRQERDPLAWL
jgi:dinuclear metal center YbgI/SA1388 family protein